MLEIKWPSIKFAIKPLFIILKKYFYIFCLEYLNIKVNPELFISVTDKFATNRITSEFKLKIKMSNYHFNNIDKVHLKKI